MNHAMVGPKRKEKNRQRSTSIGRGYVHIYTGNGKGKTTAALGLAFRAMGRGFSTYIGQFMKGQPYGEVEAARQMNNFITIEQFGEKGNTHIKNPPEKRDLQQAQRGLIKARQAMLSGLYDIVVFDEIITAHYYQLITMEDMLDIIKLKPFGVELILTGRCAPQQLINAADLVTEMVEVKHYYQRGITARNGIEY